MKLLFACPTYGPVPDPSIDKNHRTAIMMAANRGVSWVGDVSPDRMGWAAARNAVVEAALSVADETEVDGVFWVDSDILMPPETIFRLSEYKLDFVSALYFQRHPPHWPLFARLNDKMSFQFPSVYPKNVLAPCDGVGFGCVLTSVNMLRKIAELPECKDVGPFGGDFGHRSYGEDFTFCLRAKKVGTTPYVDTAVKCDHLIGPEFANEETFQRLGSLMGGNGDGETRPANP